MTKYALGLLHQGDQDSMADIRENELPDDAPFPQTRNQLREQAVKNHAEIEETPGEARQTVPSYWGGGCDPPS